MRFYTFFKWLPDGEEDILKREKEDFTARLWIDYSCVNRHGEELNEEVISKWARIIQRSRVFIDVEVDNLPDELVDFIYDERESQDRLTMDCHRVKVIMKNYRHHTKILALKYNTLQLHFVIG